MVLLTLRIQIRLHLANIRSAITKEHDALVHLHPLTAQNLEQPALRFRIVGLGVPETAVGAILGHRFTDDHLEMCFLSSHYRTFCRAAIDNNLSELVCAILLGMPIPMNCPHCSFSRAIPLTAPYLPGLHSLSM
jgi:hypothetical protein